VLVEAYEKKIEKIPMSTKHATKEPIAGLGGLAVAGILVIGQ
jgi:hypothetical protein